MSLSPRLAAIGIAIAIAIVSIGIAAPVTAQDVPIVYVRCARTTQTLDVTGTVVVGGTPRTVTRTMRGLDIYDVLPDVTHFYGGFSAPCDLVHRDEHGNERVLFDCSSSSTDAASCAAMDPAISFDGQTVAFTVFRGPLTTMSENVHASVLDPAAENDDHTSVRYPNRYLDATEAQLHLVDLASGVVTALPHESGVFDSGPAFLPSGRLAFTSTRDASTSTLVFGTYGSERGSRLYSMDLEGRDLELDSPHGLSMDEHPFVLADGRVAFSSWQIFGARTFNYGNGSPGGFDTIHNHFTIFTQTPDGALQFAFWGMHAGDHEPITSIGVGHLASHFLTQTSEGRVWFADYYRGNNQGLGNVIGVMPEAEGIEGRAPGTVVGDFYAPTSAIDFASWSTSSDDFARIYAGPPFRVGTYADPVLYAGKVGHPAALPNGGLMVSWGNGPCSIVSSHQIFETLGRTAPPHTDGAGEGTAMNVITSLGLDTPGCDVGLYRATVIPSATPADLALVVDAREWHEIQGRAAVPYAAIHGIERPATIPRAALRVSHPELPVGTPYGLLGAASVIDRETHPAGGIHFAGEHQFQLQGTDTIDYDDDEICGVRILGVMPNRGASTYQEIANVAGERVSILGEIPVRNLSADGSARLDAQGLADTSFLVRIPAEVPYLMQAIDCRGRTLNTDQSWQSLRPGEVRTCGGCHVHSRAPVRPFEATYAATPEYVVPHLGEGTVPLLTGVDGSGRVTSRSVEGDGLAVDLHRDILPIFARHCTSCHGGSAPAAGLALDRPGTDDDSAGAPSTWWCLVADRDQRCVPAAQRFDTGAGSGTTFRRPQLTRYVRAFNARASLLYWKAAGERTDGRTDATYTDASPRDDRDLDFGAAHPTTLTPDELGLLSRWIDLGCAGGPMELRDTQRPTLEIAASVSGGGVTDLRVGTVDLGSGIDAASLTVCVLDALGTCVDLAGDASPHGIVTIPLAEPLRDLGVEVLARVSDRAGNETEVRRTVGYLLDSPPPVPERPDAGPRPDGGGAGAPAGVTGTCACRAGSPRGPLSPALVLALLVAVAMHRAARTRRETGYAPRSERGQA